MEEGIPSAWTCLCLFDLDHHTAEWNQKVGILFKVLKDLEYLTRQPEDSNFNPRKIRNREEEKGEGRSGQVEKWYVIDKTNKNPPLSI